MRFLLDEDLNPATAVIGRGLGLDVISVHDIDRRGSPTRSSFASRSPMAGRSLPETEMTSFGSPVRSSSRENLTTVFWSCLTACQTTVRST